MKELPLPVVGVTRYRRFIAPHMREETGLVVNVRVQYHEDGESVHSWVAMVAGQDGLQPIGHLDLAHDCHAWHPIDWVREGLYRVRPPTEEEIAASQVHEVDRCIGGLGAQEDGSLGIVGDPPVTHFKYDKATGKDDLIEMCRTLGLPTDGLKADLIARLDEFYKQE